MIILEQPSINEIDLPPLSVEMDKSDKPYSLQGRRIVNINHFVNAIINIGNHLSFLYNGTLQADKRNKSWSRICSEILLCHL
jgi:hypothetical protein